MFEFFFTYPLSAFRKGQLVFATGWPLWLLILLVAAAGAGLWWHMQQSQSRLSGRRSWLIWGLQCATAALALLMFWQPGLGIQSLKNRQNVVAVLLDTSRSMVLGEGEQSRLQQAVAALQGPVLDKLEEKFRVRLYGFSGQVNRLESLADEHLPAPGTSSRIGESLANVLRESTAVPLGAVLVVSDGSDNTGRFDRELMAEIRQRNVPVHTVGVGREEIPNDIELTDVAVSAKALPNSRVSAQVTIRHDGQSQRATRISVKDGPAVLATKDITLRPGEPIQGEWVDFSAGDPGIRNLSFTLDPVPDEEVVGNNSLRRVIDVPRRRRRILYVEGEPRWEYKFMRRAVDKDASIQLVSLLRTSTNKYYRQGVDTADQLEDGFPETAEELFEYDALIIGSFEAAFFTPKQQEMIKQFVSRRGGTLMMIAGPNGLGQGGWNTSQVADVLPVALPAGDGSFVREKVKVELTAQGRESLICRLDSDPEQNVKLWGQLPELADYQRLGALKPAAVTLLNVRVGREALPLLVRQNYGRGRGMVFATGGSWRWKMSLPSDDQRHHTFWRQLLRSLVADTQGTVLLSSDRTIYADEPRVQLRSEVRTKTYEAANNAIVTAVVTPESGEAMTIDMHPSPDEAGVYETEFTAARTGGYRVETTARIGEDRLGADTLHLRREDGVAEDFHPGQNRELLARLAEQTGGRYWGLDELAGLPEEIRFSEAGINSREILDLWDMPALFFLLLLFKGGEWLLRRKWGVV